VVLSQIYSVSSVEKRKSDLDDTESYFLSFLYFRFFYFLVFFSHSFRTDHRNGNHFPPSLLLTFQETLNRFTNESYADGIIFIRAVTRKKKNWKQQHKKKCMGKHVTICRNAETNVLIENESLESPLLSSQGFIFSEWEMWSYYKRRDHQRREKSGRGRRLFNTTATTSVLKDDAKDSF
jgi:hypothetical protein